MKRMTRWIIVPTLFAATAHAEPPPRDLAELQFQRDAIRFDHEYELSSFGKGASLHREWFAVQGDLDQRIDPEDFYRLVQRPDLIDAYNRRKDIYVAGTIVGAVGIAGSLVAFVALHPTLDDSNCALGSPAWQLCENNAHAKFEDQARSEMIWGFSLLGVGMIGAGIATWYHLHPHPISETEARQLAVAHNDKLRRTLGLPVLDVQVTPVATPSAGGLALSGRF